MKPHDPTVIRFDALPACDGQTDRYAAYSYTALPAAAARVSKIIAPLLLL